MKWPVKSIKSCQPYHTVISTQQKYFQATLKVNIKSIVNYQFHRINKQKRTLMQDN